MTKMELIKICKEKAKNCISKYDFKKKYEYWYKQCYKNKIIDEVFPNYNSKEIHYINLAKEYSLDFLLEFASKLSATDFKIKHKSFYNLLTLHYKINIKDIKFRKKKRPAPTYSTEYLINITKDLKYKIDFLNKYPKEYKFCKNKGYFKTFCKHLIPFNISMPQMILKYLTDIILNKVGALNDRIQLKPLEIDVYYDDMKLGFEYNGSHWHKNNKNNDILKNENSLKKGITLITLIENNRQYEMDIKKQLIDNLDIINNYLIDKVTKEFIQNIKIDYNNIISHDINYYIEIAKNYTNRTEFSKGSNKDYLNCEKLKIMDIIAPHFLIPKKRIWNEKSAIRNAKNYNSLEALLRNEPDCYQFIIDNNLIDNIKFKKPKIFYKDVDINYIDENFDSIYDIIQKNYSLFKYLRKNNKEIINHLKYYNENYISIRLNESITFSEFKQKNKKLMNISFNENEHKILIINYYKTKDYDKYFKLNINYSEIQDICLRYNSIKLFKKDFNKLYKYLLINKLIDKYFIHLSTLKFRNMRNKQN